MMSFKGSRPELKLSTKAMKSVQKPCSRIRSDLNCEFNCMNDGEHFSVLMGVDADLEDPNSRNIFDISDMCGDDSHRFSL